MMRRSPLKPGKALERKTPMPRGAGFQKPTAAASGLRVAAVQAKARAKELKTPKLELAFKGNRLAKNISGFMSSVSKVSLRNLDGAEMQKELRAVLSKNDSPQPKPRKALKSRGMKGRPPTAEESRFMSAIAGLGCIACKKDGWHNPDVSVHHIDGRTRAGAHLLVLPLCAGHHQHGTGTNPTLIAVHPYKARFEERYGAQRALLAECVAMIKEEGALACET